MNLFEVGQELEGGLVSEWDIDDAMVRQRAHASQGSRLLATAQAGGGDENTSVFSPVAAGAPDAAGLVPERLPLGGEVAVSGGDAKEESVVLEKLIGVAQHLDAAVLWRSVHFAENLI